MSRKNTHRIQRGKRRPPASGRKPTWRLTQGDVEASADELVTFHQRFQSLFQRREQRRWSAFYLCGQLENLERKTIEPMVLALHGPNLNMMRAVQQFIGAGLWEGQLITEHPAWVHGCAENGGGGHWSQTGHAVAAEAIYKFLIGQGLAPSERGGFGRDALHLLDLQGLRFSSDKEPMPNFLRRIWQAWKRVGQAINDVVARAVLTLFYFTIFVPFGLGVRLLSDPLDMKRSSHPSGWLKRETHDRVLEDALRQS